LDASHYEVDPDADLFVKTSQSEQTASVDTVTQAQVYSSLFCFLSLHLIFVYFRQYLAAISEKCPAFECVGLPVVRKFRQHQRFNAPNYFVGCTKWKPGCNEVHRCQRLKANTDPHKLNELLTKYQEVREFAVITHNFILCIYIYIYCNCSNCMMILKRKSQSYMTAQLFYQPQHRIYIVVCNCL